jgi:hypothetical protein
MFNFGFQYTKTIINSYKKEGGGYLKSSIRVDAIPYPQFTDTTKIKYYYGNFCADVNSRMKKLLFEKEEPHDSKMMGLFWGLVDYRSKILQPDKK